MNNFQYDFFPWSEDAILMEIEKLRAEITDARKALFARIGELKKEQAALVAEIEDLRELKEALMQNIANI